MQTEMMLRLIKDDKIVGYLEISRRTDLDKMSIMFFENYDHEHDTAVDRPPFDFFELGIEVDDVWWFEGDKAKWDGKGIPRRSFTVIWDNRQKCFNRLYHDTNEESSWTGISFEGYIRDGSIHEGKK